MMVQQKKNAGHANHFKSPRSHIKKVKGKQMKFISAIYFI